VKRREILSTVMHPPHVAAICWKRLAAQVRAAPIPRLGSVVMDAVCRVPNPIIVVTSAFSRVEDGAGKAAAARSSGTARIGMAHRGPIFGSAQAGIAMSIANLRPTRPQLHDFHSIKNDMT
jgi:hypothetical protein